MRVWTHSDLCERACQWLSGSRRCGVVLSGIASTAEIPDAIGWSTSWRNFGSMVIECKTSVADFHNDAKKKHEKRMGNRRYFMCPENLLTVEQVSAKHPDHGLLYVKGRTVTVVKESIVRPEANLQAENRLLHFALVHCRSNLLHLGFTVDLNLLSLHPFTVRRRVETDKWLSKNELHDLVLPRGDS